MLLHWYLYGVLEHVSSLTENPSVHIKLIDNNFDNCIKQKACTLGSNLCHVKVAFVFYICPFGLLVGQNRVNVLRKKGCLS